MTLLSICWPRSFRSLSSLQNHSLFDPARRVLVGSGLHAAYLPSFLPIDHAQRSLFMPTKAARTSPLASPPPPHLPLVRPSEASDIRAVREEKERRSLCCYRNRMIKPLRRPCLDKLQHIRVRCGEILHTRVTAALRFFLCRLGRNRKCNVRNVICVSLSNGTKTLTEERVGKVQRATCFGEVGTRL